MSARLLITAAVAAGGLAAVPAAAQAVPSNCVLSHSGNSVSVRCTSGTGEVRVVADCLLVKPGNDPKEWISYGAWVGVGGTSTVTCGNRPPAGDYELR